MEENSDTNNPYSHHSAESLAQDGEISGYSADVSHNLLNAHHEYGDLGHTQEVHSLEEQHNLPNEYLSEQSQNHNLYGLEDHASHLYRENDSADNLYANHTSQFHGDVGQTANFYDVNGHTSLEHDQQPSEYTTNNGEADLYGNTHSNTADSYLTAGSTDTLNYQENTQNSYLQTDQIGSLQSGILGSLEQLYEVVVDWVKDAIAWVSPNQDTHEPTHQGWQPSDFDGVGVPLQDSQHWHHQQGSSSCAVVAQISVYEAITGKELSESKACQYVQQQGYFNPESGTITKDIGKLLNALGLHTEQKFNSKLSDIARALENGDKVIVALDSNEIWNPMHDRAGLPIEQPTGGHAVWVTGMDPQPDGSIKIILNDSGTSNGKMEAVNVLDFLNAWHDRDNFMLVVDASNPMQGALV